MSQKAKISIKNLVENPLILYLIKFMNHQFLNCLKKNPTCKNSLCNPDDCIYDEDIHPLAIIIHFLFLFKDNVSYLATLCFISNVNPNCFK